MLLLLKHPVHLSKGSVIYYGSYTMAKLQKAMWGRVIQHKLTLEHNWPLLAHTVRIDEEIVIPNFVALRAVFFLYVRKPSGSGYPSPPPSVCAWLYSQVKYQVIFMIPWQFQSASLSQSPPDVESRSRCLSPSPATGAAASSSRRIAREAATERRAQPEARICMWPATLPGTVRQFGLHRSTDLTLRVITIQ